MAGSTIVVVAAGLFYAYDRTQRTKDWSNVQNSAIRVESGIRHEPLIALRSKIADLDAALNQYVREHPARNREARTIRMKQAITSLEWAIAHQSDGMFVKDGTEEFSEFERLTFLITEPECEESTGKLFLRTTAIAKASLEFAQTTLLSPDRPPLTRATEISLIRDRCIGAKTAYDNRRVEAQESARRELAKQEELKRLEHVKAWPIQVDIVGTRDLTDELAGENIDGEEQPYTSFKRHIDARHYVELKHIGPTPPELTVRVNGKQYDHTWWVANQDGATSYYTLRIERKSHIGQ